MTSGRPGVGRDVNLHRSAPEYQARVLAWADAVSADGCPGGQPLR